MPLSPELGSPRSPPTTTAQASSTTPKDPKGKRKAKKEEEEIDDSPPTLNRRGQPIEPLFKKMPKAISQAAKAAGLVAGQKAAEKLNDEEGLGKLEAEHKARMRAVEQQRQQQQQKQQQRQKQQQQQRQHQKQQQKPMQQQQQQQLQQQHQQPQQQPQQQQQHQHQQQHQQQQRQQRQQQPQQQQEQPQQQQSQQQQHQLRQQHQLQQHQHQQQSQQQQQQPQHPQRQYMRSILSQSWPADVDKPDSVLREMQFNPAYPYRQSNQKRQFLAILQHRGQVAPPDLLEVLYYRELRDAYFAVLNAMGSSRIKGLAFAEAITLDEMQRRLENCMEEVWGAPPKKVIKVVKSVQWCAPTPEHYGNIGKYDYGTEYLGSALDRQRGNSRFRSESDDWEASVASTASRSGSADPRKHRERHPPPPRDKGWLALFIIALIYLAGIYLTNWWDNMVNPAATSITMPTETAAAGGGTWESLLNPFSIFSHVEADDSEPSYAQLSTAYETSPGDVEQAAHEDYLTHPDRHIWAHLARVEEQLRKERAKAVPLTRPSGYDGPLDASGPIPWYLDGGNLADDGGRVLGYDRHPGSASPNQKKHDCDSDGGEVFGCTHPPGSASPDRKKHGSDNDGGPSVGCTRHPGSASPNPKKHDFDNDGEPSAGCTRQKRGTSGRWGYN